MAADISSLVAALETELHGMARESDEIEFLQHYMGTVRPLLCVGISDVRALGKSFVKTNPDLTAAERTAILDALYAAPVFEERLLAATVLHAMSDYRKQVNLDDLERWLRGLSGWAEVDTTCQNGWTHGELLARWPIWDATLARFAADPSPSLRRASLILLVSPLRSSADPRLSRRAFANIEALKSEREVIITKAISWLLRTLLRHHAAAVRAYLDEQESTLPRIAVRETRKKLETGKK